MHPYPANSNSIWMTVFATGVAFLFSWFFSREISGFLSPRAPSSK
jgi:hypothetical protein